MKTKFSYSKKPLPHSTIKELKHESKEPAIAFTVRLPLSEYQKLDKAVDEHGFDKQIIIRKALEAFLK